MIKAEGRKAKLTGTIYDIMQEFQAVVQGMSKLIEDDHRTGMEPGYFVQGLASLALGGQSFYVWTGADTPPKNNEYVLLSFENFSSHLWEDTRRIATAGLTTLETTQERVVPMA